MPFDRFNGRSAFSISGPNDRAPHARCLAKNDATRAMRPIRSVFSLRMAHSGASSSPLRGGFARTPLLFRYRKFRLEERKLTRLQKLASYLLHLSFRNPISARDVCLRCTDSNNKQAPSTHSKSLASSSSWTATATTTNKQTTTTIVTTTDSPAREGRTFSPIFI